MKKKILYILHFILAMLFFYKNYNFELNVGSGMFLITGAVGSYIINNYYRE